MPGHRRPGAGAEVGGRARDGAGDRDAADQRRDQVGHALRQELGAGVVPIAGHRIGDDRRQEAFDRREQRHRQGRRQERQDQVRAERRDGHGGQAAGNPAELRADRFDGEAEAPPPRSCQRPAPRSSPARGATIVGPARTMASDPTASVSATGFQLRQPGAERRHAREELARRFGDGQPEEVLDLGGRNQQRDAVGEADDDRPRDELDGLPQSGEPPGRSG